MGSKCCREERSSTPCMGAAAGSEHQLHCCAKPPKVLHTLPVNEDLSSSALDDNFILPTAVDVNAVASFKTSLEKAGIDTSAFGKGNAKPLELLYYQVQEKQCYLEATLSKGKGGGSLRRVVEQVQITLVATLDGIDHVLVQDSQMRNDGRSLIRKQLPVHRITSGQTWKEGLEQCFEKRFQIPAREQRHLLSVDNQSYSFRKEEEDLSQDYPGLPTLYNFHQVVVYVEHPLDPIMERMGLPDGLGFSSLEPRLGGADVRARLNVWAWEVASAAARQRIIAEREERTTEETLSKRFTIVQTLLSLKRKRAVVSEEDLAQRVPVPEQSGPLKTTEAIKGCPNPMLAAMAADQKPDEEALARAARCIRNPDYSLRNFYDDCLAAFPELRMYACQPPAPAESLSRQGSKMSSASKAQKDNIAPRRIDDEFQRTIGALFSLYWLVRLDGDGKDGFCYGVDDTWSVKTKPTCQMPDTAKPFMKMSKAQKRFRFMSEGPWNWVEELLVDAGLWTCNGEGSISVAEERMKAMLVLTAVHDLMKIEALIPRVQPGNGPFCGFSEEEEIGDHDVALAYVVEHFPHLLPSVQGLTAESRQLVLFTQSKMDFNSGWLVQAEAPPGKLLRTFKSTVKQARARSYMSSPFRPEDIAFYFVHWVTDLAGAVATPLAGSEKFVTQFPHALLGTLLKSFKVIMKLATQDEASVYEDYLRMRWNEMNPPLPQMQPGAEAICCQRLVCLAQHAAPQILAAYERMPLADQRFLSDELAMTGIRGQTFGDDPKKKGGLGGVISWRSVDERPPEAGGVGEVGPAFHVYYGPALLQKNGVMEPDVALQMLVGILRAGRAIWPSSAEAADDTVTLRMDMLRECSVDDVRNSMIQGEVWLLVWHSESEAFVERHPLVMLNSFNKSTKPYQVLTLLQGEKLAERRQLWF